MTTNKDAVEAAEKEYPHVHETENGPLIDSIVNSKLNDKREGYVKGWRAHEASAPTQREGEAVNDITEEEAIRLLREGPITVVPSPVSVEDIVDLVAELYGDRSHKHGGGINIDQFRKRLSSLLSQ